MVDCARFLEEYSAYRDGILPAAELAVFDGHLATCASCARYDRVVQRGTALVRELPEIEVSDDFGARLQHRIWHEEMDRRTRTRRLRTAGYAGSMALAAAFAGVAVGVSRDGESPRSLPAAVAGHFPALDALVVDAAHPEAGRVSTQLARLGVRIAELPYHDVVYRREGALVASLAAYTEHDPSGSPAAR